jgi:peptidoglycan/xylan/chitin deacetylase (PgdA/CDA1 family)
VPQKLVIIDSKIVGRGCWLEVPILAYHKISDQFEWGINNVPIRSFENQIKYLAENHFYTISLEQYLCDEFSANSERHPVIITFDDADESVLHHAFPILYAYRFTATLFVISNYVGKLNSWDANLGGIYSRHLGWEEIKELAEVGWEIGSHTATHRDLRGLSDNELNLELQFSKELIERNVQKPIRFLSYPFGRFDYRVCLTAQQLGYSGGCGLSVSQYGIPAAFNIRRHGVYLIDTLFWFKRKLSNSKIEQLKQRIISFGSKGTVFYQKYRK